MAKQHISHTFISRILSRSLCAALALLMAVLVFGCSQTAQSTAESSETSGQAEASATVSAGAEDDSAENQVQSKRSRIANSHVGNTLPVDQNDLNTGDWLNTRHVVYRTGQSEIQELSVSETEYDSEGRVSVTRNSSQGEPSSEIHYSYGDDGTTIQMYDVENGELVETAPAITFRSWDEDGAEYSTQSRGGSVVSYTVTRDADDGRSSTTESYVDGDEESGELSFTRTSVYDDQGRLLRYVQDDLPTRNDSTEYDSVQSWAYAQDGTGAGFTQSGQYDANTNAMMKSNGASFVVNDAKGRLVYRLQTPAVDGASPTEEYIEYDEWDNPTLRLTFEGSVIESKEEFAYDDNGNLLYTARTDWQDSGDAFYNVEAYGYVNKITGETIEAVELDSITLPAIGQSDYGIKTTLFPDMGPFERASYSDGGNLAQFGDGEYGATVSFTSGSNVGNVGTLSVYKEPEDPSALAVDWSTFGTFYAVPVNSGEIVGVGSDGTGITLVPSGDGAYEAHIRTAEGIEVDLTLSTNQ